MDNLSRFLSSDFFNYSFLGNTFYQYLATFIIFLVLLLIFGLFNKVALVKLRKLALKTKTDLDETFIDILKSIKPPFYSFLAIYVSSNFLEINDLWQSVLNYTLIILVVYQVVVAVSILIDYFVRKKSSGEETENTKSALNFMGRLAKGLVWLFAALFILSNFGVNITSLVAGLGIGGIAVALALQNILSDLFSSFAIYFDKPFEIGDFIVVGDKMGTVEYVGIKTTRLRALQGEEIVISNRELTTAQIQNFKKMKERRVVINFGVTYETPDKKLKKIDSIVQKVIEDISDTRFDRVHFKEFADSSLNFEAVYYVKSGDFNVYMDINQSIHFGILDAFRKEEISIAYPTQTLFVQKQ